MVRYLTRFFTAVFWGGAGGAITFFAFPSYSLWPCAFLGLALLMHAVLQGSGAFGFIAGFSWGCTFMLPLTPWAWTSVNSVAPWLALAGVEIVLISLWSWSAGVGVYYLRKSRFSWLHVPMLPLTWAGLEQVRGTFPYGGFPWGLMAQSQVDSPLRFLAPWGGEVVIGVVVALVATLLASAFKAYSWRHTLVFSLIAILLIPASLLLPTPRLPQIGKLRVAVVQGGIDRPDKLPYTKYLKVFNDHLAQTRTLQPNSADLVVWGENASDVDPRTDAVAARLLSSEVKRLGAPIMIGAVPTRGALRYNEYYTWGADNKPVGPSYAKQHPVPFGEYIPNRSFFSKISKDVEQIPVDMAPGTKPGILPVILPSHQVNVAVGICFEVAYSSLISESVAKGGQLLIIPTNNFSFGDSDESTQQFAMTRLRALETGRSAIQVSTMGVSGVSGPGGEVLKETGLWTKEAFISEVPLHTGITWSVRYGASIASVVVAMWLILIVGISLGYVKIKFACFTGKKAKR